MADMKQKALKLLEDPKTHIGVLGTASKDGEPNIAYISGTRAMEDGTVVIGLWNNRSLANIEENPRCIYLVIDGFPVTVETKGFRIYLRAKDIDREGASLAAIREYIAAEFDVNAAKMTTAAVVCEVTDVRPLLDMPAPPE